MGREWAPARGYSRSVDCIVLVKQVPDVSNIPEDAWDREKGTLRRAMLDNILNPLDLHALTFADRLSRAGGTGRVVFLTMEDETGAVRDQEVREAQPVGLSTIGSLMK